jgi:predicted transcriptional regulator
VACINADGTLTRSGELILLALRTPLTPEQISQETGVPLFKVRSALREFLAAGVVEETDGKYSCNSHGQAMVEGSSELI